MKRKIRVFTWFITICLLLSSFAGCKKDETPGDGTDSGTAAGTGMIVDNGTAVYTVVYHKNATETVKNEALRLISIIKEATGVELTLKTDEIKRGGVYDSSTCEILFGRTDYSESADAIKQLEDTQYTFKQVGKKLVISSATDTNLEKAVTYFEENMLSSCLVDGGKSLKVFPDYTSEPYEIDLTNDVQLGAHKLSEYSIVYAADGDGYLAIAETMKTVITARYGVTLSVYSDAEQADSGKPEFLLGKTNRTASTAAYQETLKLLNFRIVVSGNKIALCGKGGFSVRRCTETAVSKMAELTADGEYYKTELAPGTVEPADNADIRIMTSNVLSARWGELLPEEESINALPIAERSEIYAAILAKYQPDAIGLQEACEVWGEKLPAYLQVLKDEYGIEYTWLHHTYNYLDHDYMSMTSILYRSDKFDVVEKGYQPVSYWIEEWESLRHDYFIRSFAWAQLRMKSNPQKEFIVLNTHWELNERLEKVQKCLQEHAALVNQLYTQYDVPVICTGDFNSKNKSEDYYTFLDASGLHDMMYEAEDNNGRINLAGGNGEMGKVRPNSGNYIDHIYGTSECTGLRFETIVSDMSHFMTDHSAMVADIKLN